MRQPVVMPKKAAFLAAGQRADKGRFRYRAGLLAMLLFLSGLGLSSASAEQAETPLFIYLASDRIADNPFLELARRGVQEAAVRYRADSLILQAVHPADRSPLLHLALADKPDVLVLSGFAFNQLLAKLAPQHPNTQIIRIDHCLELRPANLHCAVFREYEVAYLIGFTAARLSQTGQLGVVGALDIPLLRRFSVGFARGARAARPQIEVAVRWVGGDNPFADPARAASLAGQLHAGGADVIFSATSGGDSGVFEQAGRDQFLVFSVDINRCPMAAGRLVDNALKPVDRVVGKMLEQVMEEKPAARHSFGLAEGGMDMMALRRPAERASSRCLIADHPELLAKLGQLAGAIASGALTLSDPALE